MSNVRADYEELRRFAQRLEKYVEAMNVETSGVVSAFRSLEETWNDQQKNKFKEEFQTLINAFKRFKEETSQQIPHLKKLAQKLEDYHRS